MFNTTDLLNEDSNSSELKKLNKSKSNEELFINAIIKKNANETKDKIGEYFKLKLSNKHNYKLNEIRTNIQKNK
jgi:hypothetical protein